MFYYLIDRETRRIEKYLGNPDEFNYEAEEQRYFLTSFDQDYEISELYYSEDGFTPHARIKPPPPQLPPTQYAAWFTDKWVVFTYPPPKFVETPFYKEVEDLARKDIEVLLKLISFAYILPQSEFSWDFPEIKASFVKWVEDYKNAHPPL